MATDPSAWTEFAAAMVAASSALAGLIFVALSINLDRILTLPGISDVALEGVVALTVVLIASIVVLAPGLSVGALSAGLVLIGLVELAIIAWLLRRTLIVAQVEFRMKRVQMALVSGLPGLLFAISGLALAAGNIWGLYWLVPASIAGIAAGVTNAWVLLIEIKR
ncbi:MAG TPA: hypothetical protein VGJ17_00880 [Candidatus Limnocylindrales bacterium]